MFKSLVKTLVTKVAPGKDLTYEEARDILESESAAAKKKVAAESSSKPEMLYYLAEDENDEIRTLVASNPSTPIQADRFLADDSNDEVRSQLALKIARLLPGLSGEETTKLREQALEILELLAQDHLPRVRQIVSEELKSSDSVPRELIKNLAKDIEQIVAAPVLEYSPLLSDEDLLEIMAGGIANGALSAIAKRSSVSEEVSDQIVASLDIPAVAALLVNPNAHIREQTLDGIVEHAEDIEDWHQPLVLRPDLSLRATKRIAGFVASSLLHTLSERNNLDPKMVDDLQKNVHGRIQQESSLLQEDKEEEERATGRVDAAHQAGTLNNTFVMQAVKAADQPLVIAALCKLTNKDSRFVVRVLSSQQGKGITSLVWLAGLSMRTALAVQKMFNVPPDSMTMARDGVDYPMEGAEMTWHLRYFAQFD